MLTTQDSQKKCCGEKLR